MPVPTKIHAQTHTHTFPFVVSSHNGESSLQWTTFKKINSKKSYLSSSALPSSFLSPGQCSTTLPGQLPTGLFPSPARTRSLQSACPFAHPSLLSHLWDSLPLRAANAACPHSDGWGQSYISNWCKEEVCDIHICFSDSTYGLFLCALACVHQKNKISLEWRHIYLQSI